MTGNAIREALEPFAKVAEGWSEATPDDFEFRSANFLTVGDLRRARAAYDTIGSGVKALEWLPHGMLGTTAKTPFGDYHISEDLFLGCIWLERQKYPTLDEAKAAAQADFERRVLSCLSPVAVEEADAKADEDAFVRMTEEELLAGIDLLRTPSTPSPQIGNAGAGPVGEAVAWWNGCDETVPEALRFLAENDRPGGGEQRFNSAHLYQLAGEIERMARKPLYARPVEEPGEVERLIEETGSSSVDDLRDMAIVGHSLMNAVHHATQDGAYKNWAPAEDPAEIVADLINDLDEAQANVVRLTLAVEDNLQAAKEAEEARNEAIRGERAAEAVLAKTREAINAALRHGDVGSHSARALRAALTGDAQEDGR